MSDLLRIADRQFNSRLFVGTGKYRSFQEMARCHAASGAEVVTVAVRRVNLTDKSKESLLDYVDRSRMFILPNTAGCYTADEALLTCTSYCLAGVRQINRREIPWPGPMLRRLPEAWSAEVGIDFHQQILAH